MGSGCWGPSPLEGLWGSDIWAKSPRVGLLPQPWVCGLSTAAQTSCCLQEALAGGGKPGAPWLEGLTKQPV